MSRPSGSTAMAPAMQSRCFCAAGETRARLVEPLLDLVPEVGAAQGLLHDLVRLRLAGPALELVAGHHVVVDRHGGERVRALEHHPDGPPDVDRIDAGGVDVLV